MFLFKKCIYNCNFILIRIMQKKEGEIKEVKQTKKASENKTIEGKMCIPNLDLKINYETF